MRVCPKCVGAKNEEIAALKARLDVYERPLVGVGPRTMTLPEAMTEVTKRLRAERDVAESFLRVERGLNAELHTERDALRDRMVAADRILGAAHPGVHRDCALCDVRRTLVDAGPVVAESVRDMLHPKESTT